MTACRIDLFFVSEILNKTSVPDFEFSTNAVCEISEFAGGNLDCDLILEAIFETTTVVEPLDETTTVSVTATEEISTDQSALIAVLNCSF